VAWVLYQKPFRIVQDVVVESTPAVVASLGRQLTLNGTLRYQAYDDTICFSPQTVPLTWTVMVRGLDRGRPP
jgi:hypothetical protein